MLTWRRCRVAPLHNAAVTLYGRDGLIEEAMQATEPVLLITGDSGVGKSALLAEILDEGRAQDS